MPSATEPAEPTERPEPPEPAEPAVEPRSALTLLHARVTGEGPRLVAAHGFTHTGETWGPMMDDLAHDHQVVLVDMPGHGGSSHLATDLDDGARLLGVTGQRASYLGYSMGARFCLHLALARPDLVEALVLISGTPGIEDDDERAARRASDEAMADELDPVGGNSPTASERQARVDDFLRRWLARPLFAGIPDATAGLAERRRNSDTGLASSLRFAGTGAQRPLWSRLHRLSMPVLVVTGEDDRKFTELGHRMVEAIGPNAVHAVIPGTGHSPHLQQPGLVASLVRSHVGSRRAAPPTDD